VIGSVRTDAETSLVDQGVADDVVSLESEPVADPPAGARSREVLPTGPSYPGLKGEATFRSGEKILYRTEGGASMDVFTAAPARGRAW
jgi:hypothetical protein